jgi:acyl carrier protein
MTMEDKIIKIVAEILEMDEKRISLETTQQEIEEWDSLAHIRMIAEIEEQLGVLVPIEKVAEIYTVKDLIQAVQE